MKIIKFNVLIVCIALIAMGCQPASDTTEKSNPGQEAFQKNAETVLAYLDAWQNEDVDYDKFYATDYEAWGTGFGDLDTMNLEMVKEWDQRMFATFDFKLINGPVNLLPGVDVQTKQMDGSVRHYSEWEITRVATDSSDARTGKLRMYQAFVFNEEGKIQLDLTYGDFGGLMQYLFKEEQ
jgi:hypothetical protein